MLGTCDQCWLSLDRQNPQVKWTDCLQINPAASEQQRDPLPYPPGNVNETVTHHLGPNATEQDFLAEDLTPDYDFYDDDHDFDPDHGDLEVTPEMGEKTSMQRFLSREGEL